jgi:hypothetical protein
MKFFHSPIHKRAAAYISIGLIAAACSSDLTVKNKESPAELLRVGPEINLGRSEANPAAPFLRVAPDGRLFAVWTEDHDAHSPQGKASTGHQHIAGDRTPAPMRNALLAWSADGGRTWSPPWRVNSGVEAVQAEENGPKVAFTNNKAYVVWSIPSERGDKTRANIRFASGDGNSHFTEARTLNEVKDTGRFPIAVFRLSKRPPMAICWSPGSIDASTTPNRASFI